MSIRRTHTLFFRFLLSPQPLHTPYCTQQVEPRAYDSCRDSRATCPQHHCPRWSVRSACFFFLLVSQFLGHELRLEEYKLCSFGQLYTWGAFAWSCEVLVFERHLFSHGVDERDSTLAARNVDVLVRRRRRDLPIRPLPRFTPEQTPSILRSRLLSPGYMSSPGYPSAGTNVTFQPPRVSPPGTPTLTGGQSKNTTRLM